MRKYCSASRQVRLAGRGRRPSVGPSCAPCRHRRVLRVSGRDRCQLRSPVRHRVRRSPAGPARRSCSVSLEFAPVDVEARGVDLGPGGRRHPGVGPGAVVAEQPAALVVVADPHVLVAVHVVVDPRGVPGLQRETTAVLAILVPAGAARLSWSWAAVGLVGVVSALWWADPRRCGGTPSPVGATASRCSSSSSRSPLGCSESSWCWSARVRQGGNGVPVGKRRSTSAEPRRAPRSARPPNDPCDRRARGPRIPAGHVDPESTVRLSARRSSRRPYVSSTQVSR
jgi:hypothetical protein